MNNRLVRDVWEVCRRCVRDEWKMTERWIRIRGRSASRTYSMSRKWVRVQ